MKKFFSKNDEEANLQKAYDQKLEEALNAQAKGDLSKSKQLLQQSQQIFIKWADEVKAD